MGTLQKSNLGNLCSASRDHRGGEMARNYWDSTQRKLTDKMNSESFRKEHETITSRDIQTAPGLTRDSARHLPMHLTQLLFRCAKTLELHCQVAATATVFLKRFLLRFGLTYG